LAIPLLLLLGAAGGVWWYMRPPATVFWQGYAEADFVKVGPTQAGLLTAVLVSRGDQVTNGALLFTQDEIDDRAASEQATQMLAQAAKQLANLLEGGKPTEIEQAGANLNRCPIHAGAHHC
jgi:HlyD family secretion protein